MLHWTDEHIANAPFELLEEEQDIDIQAIEELDKCKFGHGNTISYQESKYIDKLNEITKAIKQIDREIKREEK